MGSELAEGKSLNQWVSITVGVNREIRNFEIVNPFNIFK